MGCAINDAVNVAQVMASDPATLAHMALAVASFAPPPVGTVAAMADIGLSLVEGDYESVAMGMAMLVPGGAALAMAARFAKGGMKVAGAASKLASLGSKVTGAVSKVTGAVSNAVHKVVDAVKSAVKGLKGGGKSVPEIHFGAKTPNITGNIRKAQADGRNMVLHREANPSAIAGNRAANRSVWHGKGSMEEFPFASTKEGGLGASLAGVPLAEQRIQGGTISSFYQRFGIQDGDPFRVIAD
jgi:hypothetical protein